MKKLFSYVALLMSLSLPSQALVVLQYHHIDDDTPAITSTRIDDFDEHIELLQEEGMEIVDLKDALHKVKNNQSLPKKAVAITFDDAYLSIYENAWPKLKELQWPFTIFVNPKQIDNQVANMISWEQLQEMQDAGAIIANHSQSHPYLIEHDSNQDGSEQALADYLDKEINGAEERLLEKLGTSHKIFAYPYGEFNTDIMQWLKAQGYMAIGQHSGAVGPNTNWQAIPRYPAGGIYANPSTLKTKLRTLAFPISGDQFVDPVLGDSNPPTLELSFRLDDIHLNQVQCYSGAEGALSTEVSQDAGLIQLNTAAKKPITAGRDRYNCTAPSRKNPGWYYWYSQYWINTDVSNR